MPIESPPLPAAIALLPALAPAVALLPALVLPAALELLPALELDPVPALDPLPAFGVLDPAFPLLAEVPADADAIRPAVELDPLLPLDDDIELPAAAWVAPVPEFVDILLLVTDGSFEPPQLTAVTKQSAAHGFIALRVMLKLLEKGISP